MSDIFITLFIAVVSFFVFLIGEPVVRWLLRVFGVYAIVEEGTCHVYVLFGKVVSVLKEPGLHLLWLKLGPRAIINLLGERHILDMRLDQQYLRSLPVNSEEGAPMGIGVWYEMQISDPVAYLFKNTDRAAPFGQRQQRHGAHAEQHAAGRYARNPPRDEPGRARGGLAQVGAVGLPARLGLRA